MSATGSAKSSQKKTFRGDIEGLRAVAVLGVVLDHVFEWPHGGFLGVDVFFVISGFLITGLLLKEHARTGRISFTGFYRRRIRRILPAAMLVLVATCAAAHFVLTGARARQTYDDSIWAAIFGANWHFALEGTDYFQSVLPPSPIQHYWSLAVEEQFYVVWPWFALAILFLVRRRGATVGKMVLFGLFGVVVAASFAWALVDTRDNATWAYFSTFTRVWQLAAGAALAVVAANLSRLPMAVRAVAAWLGLGAILGSFLLIRSDSGVPAPWAAIPVIGTLLILGSGVGAPHHRYMFLLENPATRYIGRISYSLYLWHWPVIVLIAAMVPEMTVGLQVLALLLGVALSIASFHLVEDQVLKSEWLSGKPRSRGGKWTLSERTQNVALGCLGVVVLYMAAVALQPAEPPLSSASRPQLLSAESTGDTGDSQKSAGLLGSIQSELDQSLAADKFPRLVPGPDDLEALPPGRVDPSSKCAPAAPASCAPGSGAAGTIAVIGDSISQAYLPTWRMAVEPWGWKVIDLTYTGCQMINTRVDNPEVDVCEKRRAETPGMLDDASPDVIVIANAYAAADHLESGAQGQEAADEWGKAIGDTYAMAKKHAPKVIAISAPPEGKDPQLCITKFSRPSDCVTTISDRWSQVADAEQAAAKRNGVTFVDTRYWLCSMTDDSCPAFVAGMAMRRDAIHINQAFAEYISPLLTEQLVKAKMLPRAALPDGSAAKPPKA